MRTLNIIRILECYDIPQLFVAEDSVGTRYLCLHYEIDDAGDLKYIAIQVSPNKLNDFIKGHIDLRSMLLNVEQDGSVFIATYDGENITAEDYRGEIESKMLPQSGYYFDDTLGEDEEMIARAITNNKPIIRLAFETPDNSHDIDSRCLSAALLSFQSLIDSSFKKLFKTDESSASALRVSAFMPASFDVEFLANENLDMFGQSRLGETFENINKLFSDENDEVVETLRHLKGFAANNYRRFLDVLLNYGVSLKYKWVFSTLESEVHQNRISSSRLRDLQAIINANSDLGTEEQSIEGIFTAASTDTGKWTFLPVTGKEIRGDCEDKTMLKGITLTEQPYTIACEVIQTVNDTTLKEKSKYYLKSISPRQ
ncbi:hypothetical protein B5F83_09410 [Muribaculum sp. An289]|uniref:DUF6575 domain-containing protein n=1 Tax=unclassified Muribaculum TaxID=2622126 RepID=UPI000B3813FC|nr:MULTISPECIES: DUF6575 domain-containing protein [unclassified Muribaculum]OUO36124.1 hypothetical protein B5F83_09410 [Muribaculum sp. An289]OUO41122.1 hypothetical protein B5F81_09625 [Muribaculum sp. An287]